MNEWLVLLKNVDTKPFLQCTKLIKHYKNDIDDINLSTRGEKSIQYSFPVEGIMMSKLSNLFIDHIKKIDGINTVDLFQESAWQVDGEKGSYHRMHNHAGKSPKGLSCVLYLDVPDNKDRAEFFYLLRKDDETICDSIFPEKGDLIVMSKTVYHGVYPQTSDGLRRTLNIDFKID